MMQVRACWEFWDLGEKNTFFGQKTCFEAFKLFSFSMRIDNNFLIIISGDSTTYQFSSVYCKWKMRIFSIFG